MATIPATMPILSEQRTESRSPSRFLGKRVHFIGIGGSGMSGLAHMLIDLGAIVTGSDATPSEATFNLTRRGVKISRNQHGEYLSRDTDLVIRTAAVKDSNTEYLSASALKVNCVKYAEALGMVMAEKFGVAVAGTHGKSTTTAMIAHALLQCGKDPSFVVGGTVPQLGGGSRSGQSDVFVAEACEYDRSFHNLRPRVAIITNIEEDHLDCYKNLDDILGSFQHFARMIPGDGLIIANGTDVNVLKALARINAPVELCALQPGFIWSTIPTENVNGCATGDVIHYGKKVARLELSVAGQHNLINATMAIAACASYGLSPDEAAKALNTFTGVDRRMTFVGEYNGAQVVDDYGHHPTEIRATLKALRERYNPQRLLCVFQPHQHSRTRFLLDDFATSFALADETIMPDIYFVRDSEAERQAVNTTDLVGRILNNGNVARYVPVFKDIVEFLRRNAKDGDLIVTMGAGNVWEIGRDLVQG